MVRRMKEKMEVSSCACPRIRPMLVAGEGACRCAMQFLSGMRWRQARGRWWRGVAGHRRGKAGCVLCRVSAERLCAGISV